MMYIETSSCALGKSAPRAVASEPMPTIARKHHTPDSIGGMCGSPLTFSTARWYFETAQLDELLLGASAGRLES
jgi:hypothetical protein